MTLRSNVLVVDDEPPLRKVLQTSLTARGFAVEEANSAERALEIVSQRPFDIVLLDISMPGMGGLEACRRIRTLMPHMGIVMVTVRDSSRMWCTRWRRALTTTSPNRSALGNWSLGYVLCSAARFPKTQA